LLKTTFNFRLLLVCALAASVGLPIGFLSLAKFMLFIGAVVILIRRATLSTRSTASTAQNPTTAILIFTILGVFAASAAWTSGSQVEAANSLSKYGKLLIIPIFGLLIKTRQEALIALASFAAGQVFLAVSAWMIFIKLPVPWALSQFSLSHNVVFSSYLDEGLMSAVLAAVSWHLRALVPGKYGRFCAMAVCLLALGNVFFLLQGRSAHVVAILLLTLAIMWQMPRKYRLVVVALPFVLVMALYLSSTKVQSRLDSLKKEVQTFSFKQGADVDSTNSSGIRLHFWHRALQSIAEHPVAGSGAGSWSNEFNRLERIGNPAHGDIQPLGNPHQEYLLWGVQLGVPGILLLLALMLSILKDSLAMDTQTARATQSAVLALAIACLFNSSLYDAQIGDFFCVVLGLLLALGLHPQARLQVTGPMNKDCTAA
jgi:O-antigen ligase